MGVALFQLNLGRWKKVWGSKIGNNEVSSNESLPLDYAWHSWMYSRNLILGFCFLKPE